MHDINLALRCADRVAIMKAGSIIDAGDPRDVVTRANLRAAFDVDVEIVETADGPLIHAARVTV